MDNQKDACVRVALRVRPQGQRERLEGSRVCTSVLPNEPQITIGGDRSFTYDHVFDQQTPQNDVYEKCVEKLVDGLFDGFNATVLAYGQTGSGKTYTMGTAFESATSANAPPEGVIPRSIRHTFEKIASSKADAVANGFIEPIFDVSVQFVELYNDDVLDLLTEDRSSSVNIRIHEDNRGEIFLHGVTIRKVGDLDETMEILRNGALNRTVASTNMNEQSSRSHAIFTLHVKQQRVAPKSIGVEGESKEVEMEMLSAKFHFVDLAGSERMKRTGATGERAREGININVGLLALGNVIAALGGANGKVTHIPYRDSKLTRLLQDSLGGNSQTLMIACVSPSDSDFVETLNTMKYANRAKEIKNKVVANQDKSSKLIGDLRSKISLLEAELLEYKQGRRTVDAEGFEVVNDQYKENVMLEAELNQLRFRVKALAETVTILRDENVSLKANVEIGNLANGNDDDMQTAIRRYVDEAERSRAQLFELSAETSILRKENSRMKAQLSSGNSILGREKLLELARKELEEKKKMVNSIATSGYASEKPESDETSLEADEEDEEEVEKMDEGDDVDDDEVEEEKSVQACNNLQNDLQDVMDEINIKERLIEELMVAERKNQQTRDTYERKLRELTARIHETEAERDKVLAEGANRKGSTKMSNEQAQRIRDEYEKRIADLMKEKKRYKMLEIENQRIIARSEKEQSQKKRIEGELLDLKKSKVSIIKQLNEATKKMKDEQKKNMKALAVKEKAARAQAFRIRTLEMKDKQREQFLKKTTTELAQARKITAQQNRAAPQQKTPVVNRRVPTTTLKDRHFSAKLAKLKWTEIEKLVDVLVRRKHTIGKMEEELDRYIKERQALMREITNAEAKFQASQNVIIRDGIVEEIDSKKVKLEYVQAQITQQQKIIGDFDEEENESMDPTTKVTIESLIQECASLAEAKYLLQHLFDLCVRRSTDSAKNDSKNKELNARMSELREVADLHENLLATAIQDSTLAEDIDSMRRPSSVTSARAISPSRIEDVISKETYKVNTPPVPSQEEAPESARKRKQQLSSPSRSKPSDLGLFTRNTAARSTIAGGASPLYANVTIRKKRSPQTPPTPRPMSISDVQPSTSTTISAVEPKRKSLAVFARLSPTWLSDTKSSLIIHRKQSRITPTVDDSVSKVLARTHTLEGHSKGVLSVDTIDTLLVTGSKDRTAKLWDLEKMQEVRTLGVHPANVSKVRFIPNSPYVVSVSMYQAIVWDHRSPDCVCAKVLTSSGQVYDGSPGDFGRNGENPPRQNTIPFLESPIAAFDVDPVGKFLYTSFSGDVRIWNIKEWMSKGRLTQSSTTGARADISVVKAVDGSVITGSRDHFVRYFEVNSGEGIIEDKVKFLTPHYDMVTAVQPIGEYLYTASKDMNIMKLSLNDYKREHMFNGAHGQHINCMAALGPYLVSGCRAGVVKFWDVNSQSNIRLIDEFTAHSDAINEISTLGDRLFTASADGTVGFWQARTG